jgi:hypothetical protein
MRPISEPAIITLLLIDAVAVLWTPTPCHHLVMETVPPAWPRSGSRMPCTVEDELVVTSSLWRMSSRLCMPYTMEDELEVAPSLWRMSSRSRTPCALGASSKLLIDATACSGYSIPISLASASMSCTVERAR